jgi:hypothetical protein
MYERATKGVRYQLTGLNLWVVALMIFFVLTIFLESLLGFFLAFLVLVFFTIGLVMFIVGNINIIRGGKEVDNTSWAVTSLILLIITPFVIMAGFFNIEPMNYIIIHIGFWTLFASLIFPYIRMGGLITGIIAIIIETVMLIYTLLVMIASNMEPTLWLVLSLLGGYFLFLEFSIIISFIKLKKMQAKLEVVEGESKRTVDVRVTGKPAPITASNMPMKRSTRMTFESTPSKTTPNERPSGFRVLEYEFSGSSKARAPVDEKELFKGIPTPAQTATPKKANEPVMGRVLKFEEAMKRAEAAPKKKEPESPKSEKYTIEEEEEIDISFEDLYLDGQTLYEILKLPITATSNDIKKAYRKRAILYHPDKNRDMGPLYAETIGLEMRKLNTAKAILLDQGKRSIYDRMLDSVMGPRTGSQ